MGKLFTWLGSVGTLAYSALLGFLIYRRWDALTRLPLNELGDFLAGAFGPLAILWLVLGYFQQGVELRINSAALKLQADELANSVEQQKELVAVAQLQHATDVEALKRQTDRHAQERAELLLASLPDFRMRVKQLPQNLQATHFAFEVYNARAACTDFYLALDGAPGKPIVRAQDHMQPRGNVRVEFGIPYSQSPQEISVLLRYVTMHGEHCSIHGNITFGRGSDGEIVATYNKTVGLEDV
jgi:hypothetical protein